VQHDRGEVRPGLTGFAVLAVAVIAGIVSFSHIEALALAHGYGIGTARLLPVSVDGLIVASSLACLTEARTHGGASRLARAGLVLGILATLAANVAAGARFGVVGALVNAWPAVAFIVASEVLLGMLRAARDVPGIRGVAETVAAVLPTAPPTVPETVADVPGGVPANVLPDGPRSTATGMPQDEPGTVPPVPAPVPAFRPGVPLRRAGRHTPPGKPKSPEKLFAAEIGRGELPSLREVKRRAACGTDRARVILDYLAGILQEAPEAA
jgi:hypothetical protein